LLVCLNILEVLLEQAFNILFVLRLQTHHRQLCPHARTLHIPIDTTLKNTLRMTSGQPTAYDGRECEPIGGDDPMSDVATMSGPR
jgi:hypothetical protein